MIVMKKNSLKLNELVRSELELTEQAVIKGGGGNDGDAPPPGGETCFCVIVTTPEGRGRTTNEAYSNKHGAPTA